jgi:hypothetical protein
MKNYQPKPTGHKRENTALCEKRLENTWSKKRFIRLSPCGECCHDGFATYVHVSKQRANI